MAAFKPNQRSALAVAEDPQTREDFEAIFGKDMVSQCERIFHESLEQVHQRQAFFRERRIVDTAVREANKELPTKVLRHQHFEPLLQWFFRSQPWVALDTRGTVTTQEMWDKERRMLAMAGERTSAHLIPEEVVDEALATRTWVERGSLPEGFLKTLLENYPNLSNPKEPIEVRMVLNTARQLGQEVFGSDLTWNREGATTLKPEDVGASGEFLAALEDAEKEGENWFQKAALFISDDWSAEDAKRLKEKALDSGFPMVFAARTGISDEQT